MRVLYYQLCCGGTSAWFSNLQRLIHHCNMWDKAAGEAMAGRECYRQGQAAYMRFAPMCPEPFIHRLG